MNKLLLLCAMAACSFIQVAAYSQTLPGFNQSIPKILNEGCDTFAYPPGSNLSYKVVAPLSNNRGFPGGTNSFGDKGKANYFDLSSSTQTHLTKVMVGMGIANGANGGNLSKPIYIKVYNSDAEYPTDELAVVETTLGELKNNAGSFAYFTFDPAVELPEGRKIFISVEYPDLIWNTSANATTKDTLALASSEFGEPLENIGWTLLSTDAWATMSDLFGNSIQFHMYPLLSSNPDACNVLSVTFADFKVAPVNKVINAYWKTVHEANNSHFNIEASTDGVRFQIVASVPSKAKNGNSNSTLPYKVALPNLPRGAQFIRLRQYDYNGKTTLSPVLRIQPIQQADGVHIFPNPASNFIYFTQSNPSAKTKGYRVVDPSGKLRMAGLLAYPLETGVQRLDVQTLAKGIYILQVHFEDGSSTLYKFIKG